MATDDIALDQEKPVPPPALVAKIKAVQKQAQSAATRLFMKRDPLEPNPTTQLGVVELVERLAKQYSRSLSARDKRCLKLYHSWVRLELGQN